MASNLLHCVDYLLMTRLLNAATLLAMIARPAVQSSTQAFIHSDILFFDTSDNAWHDEAHWIIGM